MANFGPLKAEIGSGVWGTPANFNGFRVLVSLLQRHRSTVTNQTLHDVWPSPGLVHYIYTFMSCCPVTEFCQVQNWRYVQVLCSPILTALLHGTPAAGVSQTLHGGTRNGITELSQRAPPYIRLGSHHVGMVPHSSYFRTSQDSRIVYIYAGVWYRENARVRKVTWFTYLHTLAGVYT